MISLSFLQKNSIRGIWHSWFLLCLTVCLIHLITLEIDPLTYQDEVQMVDYGRVILDPSSDWGLTWYVQDDHPVLPFNYPGLLMQELAFRATAPSGIGPRIFAMIGGVLAATCALGWLIARNTSPIIALALAFIFLIDPIFSDIYRGGRIDGWAIAACLGSCWILRAALIRSKAGRPIKARTFLAGALLVVSLFLWLGAAVMVPLVLLECYYLARLLKKLQINNVTENGWIRAALYFSLGSLIALTVLSVPIAWNGKAFLAGARTIFELQRFGAVIQHSIVDLFLVYDPFLFVTTLIAFVIRREVGVTIAFVFALLMVYQTAIYLPRVLYLTPYFIAIMGYSFSNLSYGRGYRLAKLFLQVFLVLLVIWNISQVLVIRPVIAEAQRPANEPQQFLPALKEVIGPGPHRVLLQEWQTYYAGRALGWKMYLASNPVANKEYTQFMSTMDYIILRQKPRTRATSGKLETAGFELKSTISFAPPKMSEIGWWRFKLHVPQRVYPIIKVYQKKQLPSRVEKA